MPRARGIERPSSTARRAFVGRETETEALASALVEARTGSPCVMVVDGAAGIGKTSLLRHFVSQTGPVTAVWASGDQGEGHLRWSLLEHLGRAARRAGCTELASLAGGIQPGSDPALVGMALARALAGVELVVVDDAGWGDAQSLEALRFAARRLVAEPLLIVLSGRDGGAGQVDRRWDDVISETAGQRLRMAGLSPADLSKLAADIQGRPLPASHALRLWEHTDGHPLHARVLLEQLPPVAFAPSSGRLPAPRDVVSTAVATLAGCSRQTRTLVASVAVLGSRPARSVVAAMAAAQGIDLGAALREASAADLLHETATPVGVVEFTHGLLRAAVYDDLAAGERSRLHELAATCTTGRVALGHRLTATTGPDATLALELAQQGEFDLEVGQVGQAAEAFEHAARMAGDHQAHHRYLLAATEAHLVNGDVNAAEVGLDELRQAEGATDAWTEYVLGYGDLLAARIDAAKARMERAWQILESIPPPERDPQDLPVRVASQLAVLALLDLDRDRMERFGMAAVSAEVASDWVRNFAWNIRLLGLGLTGRAAEALDIAGELQGNGQPGGLDGLAARGMVRLWSDDLRGARADLARVLARASGGEELRESQALGFLGEVDYRLGRLDEALVHTVAAVDNATEQGRVWDLPILHALACFPRAARGDLDAAAVHASTARDWADLMGSPTSLSYAAVARLAFTEASGDDAGAEEAARELAAVYRVAELGTHLYGGALVEALVRQGRLDEAVEEHDRFQSVADASGRASARMLAIRARAALAARRGERVTAEDLLAEAVERGSRLAMPLETARAQLAVGRELARSGHAVAGVEVLRSAREAFRRLGAHAYQDLALGALTAVGGASLSETFSLRGLTPSEEAVARLVAEGSTNRDVAERLFVSVKTVEFHLHHVFAKLAVKNRQELTQLLR